MVAIPAQAVILERQVNESVPCGVPGVTEQTVVFERPNAPDEPVRLVGSLAIPKTTATEYREYPIGVVTVHGWAGTRIGPHRMFVRLGRDLAAMGIPALRFDLSGRGLSSGTAATTKLDSMIADTLAARRFLMEKLGCAEVNLCGICSGGNVAIGAATLEPTKNLVLISTLPFAPPSARAAWRKTSSYLKKYAKKAADIETWRRLARGEINPKGVARTLAQSAREPDRKLKDSLRNIMSAFGQLKSPCFFIYGSADPEADPAWAPFREFCDQHNIPAQYMVIQNANHNFYSRAWSQQVEEAAARFLAAECGGG